MARWVYYSSRSGHTARLMACAGLEALRIPQQTDVPQPAVDAPFILVCPSFGDATGRGAVPKAVIRFLNDPQRRRWIRGVVGCGDRNFGASFAQAAEVIARKCAVPLLHRIELAGTPADWAQLQSLDQRLSHLS